MSLLAEERKTIIMAEIDEFGQVRVNELAKKFDVSTETIRRYLEELESEKKLKKVYGGAVKVNDEIGEPTMYEREIIRIDEKKKIANRAIACIEDRDVIVIDEGSTTLQMVKGLCEKRNLTVVTNSFPVASMLMSYSNKQQFDGEVIFIGGKVRSLHYRSSGSLSEKIAEEFFPDKAFISADGIVSKQGVMSFDLEKSLLAQVYIKNASTSYILADHSKIDTKANYRLASMEDIDYIISDIDIPGHWKTVRGIEDKWLSC
ncbi:DeoR/GlpR family transcriptional regulator of sugar metabolism [Bacillus pakistanensis]|uniref:DeoR/GlpR family transcriptional regulator of sugar metabolism n=1 Tax=Rossellomorea pakistanensis TaxID=992288 RepID=A0ABS2NGP8_9BACI|nr:DeoR/GlpR family DNA-binding transcription regulator [Bacillus pakistanensis]MBM7587007.1 DeoR/GlpR family transcriptional regulator of sugar metabolism [Bacillus pakistanensis]